VRFRRLIVLGAAVLALPLLAMPLLDAFARSSLYPAPPFPVPSPPPPPLAEVRLETEKGDAVVGWAGGAGAPAGAPVVLFFHGNGENLATLEMAGLFEEMAALGVPHLAIDYPGYGRSSGRPSEERLAAAADAALAWARREHPGRPVVAAGWSLGAAVAAALAARRQEEVAGLVALSPWTSLPELARRFFPAPLVRLALADRYDTAAAAPGIRVPALVVHGGRDEIIPAEHGRRVAAALGGPVEHRELSGAGHNDLLGRPEVWTDLRRFLSGLHAG
jgi:pimeloyl-ACP methyl ester carboxylesterase